ncbi:DUF4097 family beta strand repeat-containing protein [Streptomyces ficellus]|uniref:Adhesin domain-containing protein n=1 Tax=Streptomyces ficellus TaxID=1977088 RepID=A0A6I6F962_9ACTN|nr:hypothetical protein [Streptomyces ficellus]QGV79484.1 hypothetical protein EIZ62_15450 [Streptomyces ficellus]
MPSFDTPQPLTADIAFEVGTVRIAAGKRTDTVVRVLPSDSAEEADVRAAERTEVTCADGALRIRGPRKRSPFGKAGSVDVTVHLPAGSDVTGTWPMADFHAEGRLGDCRLTTSFGDIRIEEAAAVTLRTGFGDIRVDRASGDADVTGAGRVDIGEVTGTVTLRNANGETVLGEAGGDVRADSSNGRITVGVAHAGVDARSGYGGIRIGDVARGRVVLEAAAGALEVGVREPAAAVLDVSTRAGRIRDGVGGPEGTGRTPETVRVRARTSAGDIVIRRP